MKLDILAFGAHPDDVELGAGGTLAKHAAEGKKVGIIDLTRGEMGTRGTVDIRAKEAEKAAKILGCAIRENLGMRDGYIRNSEENQRLVISCIRKFKPDIVLTNAPSDRHPDHGHAAQLVVESSFLSGLTKLQTVFDGIPQTAWRPRKVYQYIQFHPLSPSFIVDVSAYQATKMDAIKAHESQFYNPDSTEPETVIASKYFFDSLEGRAREYGRAIYVDFGEGFIAPESIGVDDLFCLK